MSDSAEEWFEERAAIMQYDGGRSRHEAEFDAFALLLAYCWRTGLRIEHGCYLNKRRIKNGQLVWSDEQVKTLYVTTPKG
jgi:hypothetical protein